ncbi:MAG TPA: hypothetical protein ENI64_08450 [Gammaproteobacteria bacterium]|nr:hypothetical protein [Gammaproteobacteria bacterium]
MMGVRFIGFIDISSDIINKLLFTTGIILLFCLTIMSKINRSYTFTRTLRLLASIVLATLLIACESMLHSQAGTPDDVQYAQHLWAALQQGRMVGKHAKKLKPFIGAARPHGWVLEIVSGMARVGDYRGFVIVKKNYQGDNLRVSDVEKDRTRFLESISVMFQREKGYDPDNKNWFWAQYQPNGKLVTRYMMGLEIAMAGRIMKGTTQDNNRGCIYCHRSAGGDDYIFYPEIIIPQANRQKP